MRLTTSRFVTTPSHSYWQDVLRAKDTYFGNPSLQSMSALQNAMERYSRIMQVHAVGIKPPYPTCYFESTNLIAVVWPDGRWKLFHSGTLELEDEGWEDVLHDALMIADEYCRGIAEVYQEAHPDELFQVFEGLI